MDINKKKILIIGPGMQIGGVERSLLGLLDSIDYDKFDVDLFLLAHTGEFMPLINPRVNLLPENGKLALCDWSINNLIISGHFLIGTIRLFSKLYGDYYGKKNRCATISYDLCRKKVTKILKPFRKKYDMALGFFAPHYFLEDKVSAKTKIGWVHTDFGNLTEQLDPNYSLPMWSKLDGIACVSEQVKEAFDRVYPSLKDKTVVIENILSSDFARSQAEEFDASFEMPDDGVINILSVGRFCTQKNFDSIPEAARILSDRGYSFRWYLIGYGPDEELIKKRIEQWDVADRVIILGKKSNPYPYMKACDIYVQPSRYEGKAVTVREAQMLHKPVMITRFATSGSQILENVDGLICELNVDGIVSGTARLIDDSLLRQNLIRATYERDYSNSRELEKLFSQMKN